MDERISLSQAIEQNRLEEFIQQAERDGIAVDNRQTFDSALTSVIKPPQSEDQTSRSPSPGDSTGK